MLFIMKASHVILAALVVMTVTITAGACDDKDTATQPAETRSPADVAGYGNVTPAVAKKLVDDFGDGEEFVILDVRTPQEFAAGHIDGAVNIDYYASDFAERIAALDTEKTYLVYCRSGNRSASAAYKMKEQGINKYFNMTGGFNDWQNAGYPVSE